MLHDHTETRNLESMASKLTYIYSIQTPGVFVYDRACIVHVVIVCVHGIKVGTGTGSQRVSPHNFEGFWQYVYIIVTRKAT